MQFGLMKIIEEKVLELIKWLENLGSQEDYNEIGIGVGLYRDYGPNKGQPTVTGQSCPLDDNLILWLVKTLPKRPV